MTMSTTRNLVASVVLCVAGFGCQRGSPAAGAAAEPPPPLIEPELAPGSRLVDPRADEFVRQMSERLARAGAFALEAEEVYDEVPDQSPRRQLTNLRRVAMRRPDRLVGDTSGDAMNRTFWYDGKVFSALDSEQNVWASGAVPPTVDQALDWVFEQTGTVIPLGDFLYADVYARLMGDVQRGVYLGIHEAAGVPCHHLSFEQATIDWQIWIDAGREPLPRKLVITYKTEDEVPQYAVTIRKWNLQAKLPDTLFAVLAARGSDASGGRRVWRAVRSLHGRTEMTRQLTSLFTATALIVASTDGLFAQRHTGSRGSVSAASSERPHDDHQAGQHHHDPGTACDWNADGRAVGRRLQRQPPGDDRQRRVQVGEQGGERRG